MKRNKLSVLIALAATVFTSCEGGGDRHTLPTSNEYPVITIGAANAQIKTTYPASIKGIQDVEVRPKVSGFITKLYVHEGQAVKVGQILFVVDNANYQQPSVRLKQLSTPLKAVLVRQRLESFRQQQL